jgi:hypothetical protein
VMDGVGALESRSLSGHWRWWGRSGNRIFFGVVVHLRVMDRVGGFESRSLARLWLRCTAPAVAGT